MSWHNYRKVVKDSALALKRKMNAQLLLLHRRGAIPQKLYERLRSLAGWNPLLLPKVHKPHIPLHPIVSFVGSPTYWHLLSPLVCHSMSAAYNLKEFVDFITMQTVANGKILVSFYVCLRMSPQILPLLLPGSACMKTHTLVNARIFSSMYTHTFQCKRNTVFGMWASWNVFRSAFDLELSGCTICLPYNKG